MIQKLVEHKRLSLLERHHQQFKFFLKCGGRQRRLLFIGFVICVYVQAQPKDYKEKFKQQVNAITQAGKAGNFDQVIRVGKQALSWSRMNHLDSAQGTFSFFVGMSYFELDKQDSALFFLSKADSIGKANHYLKLQVRSKLKMIETYQLLSHNLKKAQQVINELAPIARTLDDKRYLASAEAAMAYQEKQNLLLDKALEHYLHALNYYKTVNDEINEAITLANIGVVLSDLKKHKESIPYFRSAIVLHIKNNKNQHAVKAYENMGNSFYQLLMLDSAKFYLNKTVEIAKQYDDVSTLASAYQGLALIMRADPSATAQKESDIYLEKSLKISKALGLGLDEAQTENYLGIAALKKKNYALSEKYLTAALKAAEKINNKSLLMESNTNLSKLYAEKKEYEKAYATLTNAFQYQDTLYEEKVLKNTVDMESKYQNRYKQKQIDKLNVEKKLTSLTHENERQRYWIFSALVGCSAITIGILYYFRNKQRLIKKDNELQTLINRVHETRHVALRAQMNPHFIFNCMAAIDDFILKNERKKASELLTSFAHFIRQGLEYSERDMISLQEELDCLDLYLKLEQSRFNDAFQYSIHVEENIEFDVPPLLLQPYVENAIIHGITHSSRTDKKIDINVTLENENKLTISIRDNGVGRKASARLNTNRNSHQSMGMRITAERIALLRSTQAMEAQVTVTDLYNEQEATGTMVTVVFENRIES